MHKIIIPCVLFWIVLSQHALKCYRKIQRDADLPLKDVVKKYGYPFEEHTVITSDGYILKIHRVPHGKHSNVTNKKPVLINHGLSADSVIFFCLGPNDSLPYMLADNGFDVWLMNARGNFFSRNHTTLKPEDNAFWNFSLHEIGVIDIPANVDYILEKTKEKSIYYVGHSQGSTTYFIFSSFLPEYNKKIRMHASLAASVSLEYVDRRGKALAKTIETITNFLKSINTYEVVTPQIHSILNEMGKTDIFLNILEGLFTILTRDREFFNDAKEYLPMLLSSSPFGVSVNQVAHFSQFTFSGFKNFDYGPEENLLKYNSTNAPRYNLSLSTAPAILFYAPFDWMATEQMSNILSQNLPNCKMYKVRIKKINHLDFVLNKKASKYIYKPMIKMFNEKKNLI